MAKPPYKFVVVAQIDGGFVLVQDFTSIDHARSFVDRKVLEFDERTLIASEICQETGRLLAVAA